MALTRGELVGYDMNRMTMRFTMLDNGVTIHCQISAKAMDALAHKRGSPDREKQFLEFRNEIECLASKLFNDKSSPGDTHVRIFAKHIDRADWRSHGTDDESSQATKSATPH